MSGNDLLGMSLLNPKDPRDLYEDTKSAYARRRDLHFLNEDGMFACNPRDRESARRAEFENMSTSNGGHQKIFEIVNLSGMRINIANRFDFNLATSPQSSIIENAIKDNSPIRVKSAAST